MLPVYSTDSDHLIYFKMAVSSICPPCFSTLQPFLTDHIHFKGLHQNTRSDLLCIEHNTYAREWQGCGSVCAGGFRESDCESSELEGPLACYVRACWIQFPFANAGQRFSSGIFASSTYDIFPAPAGACCRFSVAPDLWSEWYWIFKFWMFYTEQDCPYLPLFALSARPRHPVLC
jgi:hypothetical protein